MAKCWDTELQGLMAEQERVDRTKLDISGFSPLEASLYMWNILEPVCIMNVISQWSKIINLMTHLQFYYVLLL
jgi:hypothetical protein